MPKIPDDPPTCSISGCSNPIIARGWCRKHYARWQRTGDPEVILNKTGLVRFWEKVDKEGPVHPIYGQCWVRSGFRDRGMGYTYVTISGFRWLSHRYSWTIHFGEIPDNMSVLHKCDNPICINPCHLFLGSQADNISDKVAKDRQLKGEEVYMASLTESQVLEIRRRYIRGKTGYGSVNHLAKQFRVHPETIRKVVKRRTWKHI